MCFPFESLELPCGRQAPALSSVFSSDDGECD